MSYKSKLDEAIGYLEATKKAAQAWAANDCGQGKGGCADDSTATNKARCCVNTETPPRAKAAISLLNNIRAAATADPKVAAPFLGGLNALEGYFGKAPNWNDARYQAGSWADTVRVLDSALTELKTARGGAGPFMLIIIAIVAISVGGAFFYYYKG